ncbi:MAG TPA: ROK family protein [Sphingomicrobium sp.]
MAEAIYAGVELGGTKCVLTLAADKDRILAQEVVATTEPEVTLNAIEAILMRWHERKPVRSLGIASFGPVDLNRKSPTFGHITTTSKLRWSNTDVGQRLEKRLGVPMSFDTDVNGAAFAEMRWGAGQGMRDFAYITVGTGVGVGLIANNQSMTGFLHCEMGHLRTRRFPGDDWPGACPFHGDCVEGLASGSALKARFAGHSLDTIAPDDPIWDNVASTIAQLCHAIACTAAPHAIAIGGGVMERQPHLLARIQPLLVESLNGYFNLPDDYVRAPGLGAKAGPLGSIALALDAVA